MRKTAAEIEGDMYALINSSALKATLKGSIYRDGYRPLNAKTEDAVISFLTGLDAQTQTGVLNLNVYVADIDNGTGVLVKNGSRCRTFEMLANQIIHGFTPGNYKYSLGGIIQSFAAEGTDQHFVNARIKFELNTL